MVWKLDLGRVIPIGIEHMVVQKLLHLYQILNEIFIVRRATPPIVITSNSTYNFLLSHIVVNQFIWSAIANQEYCHFRVFELELRCKRHKKL